jgi:nucleoside phosphorylase
VKCCGKDLGRGTPYVLIRYWCDQCNTEHLVDSTEFTEYIAKLHNTVRQEVGNALPDIL